MFNIRRGARFASFIMTTVVSCSDSADEGAAPATLGPALAYKPCAVEKRVGSFEIAIDADFTTVSGSVASGVVPIDVPALVRTVGACRLLAKRNYFCDPDCKNGQTCGPDQACVPYPTNRNLGIVSVKGLVRPVVMMPVKGEQYFDTKIPHPGFAEGAAILMEASGSTPIPAFSLRGRGVAILKVAEGEIPMAKGKPFSLVWAPAAKPAHMFIRVTIDQHGSTPISVECEVPDNGAAAIPAQIVDELLAAGVSGAPQVFLARRTADSITLQDGCVEMTVLSKAERTIAIAGLP